MAEDLHKIQNITNLIDHREENICNVEAFFGSISLNIDYFTWKSIGKVMGWKME